MSTYIVELRISLPHNMFKKTESTVFEEFDSMALKNSDYLKRLAMRYPHEKR